MDLPIVSRRPPLVVAGLAGGRLRHVAAYMLYTVLWLALAALLVAVYSYAGASFFLAPDGIYQHFAAFSYTCDAVESLVAGKPVPMYGFSLGLGGDLLTTLGSYDYIDPVCILAALLPLDRIARYEVMLFVKLYLTGLSFVVLCRAMGRTDSVATASGAIAYTFSTAVIWMAVRHPNFTSWSYLLPLILGGMEYSRRGGGLLPLTVAVALTAVNNAYVFYTVTLWSIIYALVHAAVDVASTGSPSRYGSALRPYLGIAGAYACGVLIAMVVFLPTAYAYTVNARVMETTGYADSPFHYPLAYYAGLAANLFGAGDAAGYTSYIGLNPFLVVPLVALFRSWRNNLPLCILLGLAAAFLLVPLAGRLFNGLGYATNRWAFVIPLFASLALVATFDSIRAPARQDLRVYAAAAAAVCAYAALHACVRPHSQSLAGAILIASCLAAVALAYVVAAGRMPARLPGVIAALVSIGCAVQLVCLFTPQLGAYVDRFVERAAVEDALLNQSESAVPASTAEHGGFFRTENRERTVNLDGGFGVHGTGFWWSLVPDLVVSHYNGLGLDTVVQNCNVKGFDGREALLALAGVACYTERASEDFEPYGFAEVDSPDDRFRVFFDDDALAVGYAFDKRIPASEYERLDSIGKEQALLQAAVVSDEVGLEGIEPVAPTDGRVALPFSVEELDGVELEDGRMVFGGPGASVRLSLDVPADHALYFCIERPVLEPGPSHAGISVRRLAGGRSVTSGASLTNAAFNWHISHDELVFNLGVGEGGRAEVTVASDEACAVAFDEIGLVAIPMESVAEPLARLRGAMLADVQVGADAISGSIRVESESVLQIAVPYSIGWSATVDGSPAETFVSGGLFTGIRIAPGDHAIGLRYRTPLLREGAVISAVTLLALLCRSLWLHRAGRMRGDGSPSRSKEDGGEDFGGIKRVVVTGG